METASWSISHMLISYQGKVPVSVLASFQLQCLSFDNWLQGSLRLSSDLWLFLSSLSGVLGTYTVVDESCPIGPAGLGFMEKSQQSLQWSSSGSSLVLSQHLGLTGVLGGVGGLTGLFPEWLSCQPRAGTGGDSSFYGITSEISLKKKRNPEYQAQHGFEVLAPAFVNYVNTNTNLGK